MDQEREFAFPYYVEARKKAQEDIEFWKNEYVSHSETMCRCQEELQKTREQLEIATKHISRLLDLESHYEDCTYHLDDEETCDCGNEDNYYGPARDFLNTSKTNKENKE